MLDFLSKRYGEVKQFDETSDDVTNSSWRETIQKTTRSSSVVYLPWLLHFSILAFYSIFIFGALAKAQICSPCFNENLLGAPIVWDDRTYYTNAYVDHTDPYSHENPDADSVWADLIELTITVITEEEKQNLPGGRDTARAYGGQDGYAVMIEMFHQLHCLNHIRKAYFSGNHSEIYDPSGHSDHCFSYLYQTLLCHADVGVMTVKWVEEYKDFKPEFNVTKQCRDPNLIRNWQRSRKAKFFPGR